MKTIKQVTEDIEALQKYLSGKLLLKPSLFKAEQKQMEFYKLCKNYLTTTLKESYLQGEKVRLSQLIEAKENQYRHWQINICPKNIEAKNQKSIYNKEVGLTTLKNQLKTLDYLTN